MPDRVSPWGSPSRFRREFDRYGNLRPAWPFDGVPCPLVDPRGKPRKAGDIGFLIVRKNTEGEYTHLGGLMLAGTEREVVIRESVFSRVGTDRVLKHAFERAQSRPRRQPTAATKSSGTAVSMP